jgi:presenilin-like A22 family membrane protease
MTEIQERSNERTVVAVGGMVLMLVVVQLGALFLSPRMEAAGYTAFEDPSSTANPIIFLVMLLVFTGILLLLIRLKTKNIIKAIITASIFIAFIYIYSAIALQLTSSLGIGFITGIILAAASTALLYRYPEWWVIDILGVLLAAGITSIFGISLEVLPVILLLALLAVYDAISVYKTGHMIKLAEGVLEMRAPILVVVPKERGYSFIRDGLSVDRGERGAFLMGMGDLIMPSILVVSAHIFLPADGTPVFANLPSLGAMAGSLAGLLLLMHFVIRGKPQAGLPALNGGAIAGFILLCALTGNWGWLPAI